MSRRESRDRERLFYIDRRIVNDSDVTSLRLGLHTLGNAWLHECKLGVEIGKVELDGRNCSSRRHSLLGFKPEGSFLYLTSPQTTTRKRLSDLL